MIQDSSDGLFRSGPSPTIRVILLGLLSLMLMALDHRMGHLESVRAALSVVVYPIRYAADLPNTAIHRIGAFLTDRQTLLRENRDLHATQVLLRAQLQKFEALERENARLRALLHSSTQAGERVLIAELLSVDLDPYKHQLSINKGSADGVYIGQPLLDAHGVMGQITHTGPFSSTALLITDTSHATPVQFNRTGIRTIAIGAGDLNRLELPHLPNNVDVEAGDLLVTSGLGGRFPYGYPVAVVTGIETDPSGSFAHIRAVPAAHLDRTREVLLVWQRPPREPEAPSAIPESDGGQHP